MQMAVAYNIRIRNSILSFTRPENNGLISVKLRRLPGKYLLECTRTRCLPNPLVAASLQQLKRQKVFSVKLIRVLSVAGSSNKPHMVLIN